MELLAYILAMETNDEFLKELLMELFTKDERDMIWQRLKIGRWKRNNSRSIKKFYGIR